MARPPVASRRWRPGRAGPRDPAAGSHCSDRGPGAAATV